MNENLIKIMDRRGMTFTMTIWTPSTATNLKFWKWDTTRYHAGDWEAVDKGFLHPTSGDALLGSPKGPFLSSYPDSGFDSTAIDLYLGNRGSLDGPYNDLFRWGMILNGYADYANLHGGGQRRGGGVVKQNWVLAIEPGAITWDNLTWDKSAA